MRLEALALSTAADEVAFLIGAAAEVEEAVATGCVPGVAPGALRFLDGAGAAGSLPFSPPREKLDMPGKGSREELGEAAFVVACGGVGMAALEERLVFVPEDLSLSAGFVACNFLFAENSKSISGSRSSA